MVLHKLLRGALAGVYLPFALSRLREMERRDPTGFFVKKFMFQGYFIEIQQAPPFQYIRITQQAGLVNYEIFTSDHVLDSALASPGHAGGFVNSYVCGSASRHLFSSGAVTSTPLSSSTLVGDWPSRDCEDLDQTTLGFWTRRSWQNQKFFEHCWHPYNDGKSLVTSCQAQAPGLAGQCEWMSPYAVRRIPSAGSMVSDFGPDVYPTLYEGENITSGAPVLDQPHIYWRHAAVHAESGRQFFISTDSYGRFQIYPVKNYDDTDGLVTTYMQITPPYPGWVTVPNPSDAALQINDWLWRFNKDATKCVSIPYHSEFPAGFSKLLTGLTYFATIVDAGVPRIHPDYAGTVVPAREDTPGLVEFGIEITITGPEEWDFDVDFTLLRSEYFDTNKRYFFDAAYFMVDVEHDPTEDPDSVEEDALITAEVECKYAAGYYTAASVDGYYLDQAANIKGEIVININDDDLVVEREWLRFPAFGGGFGQFLTPAGYMHVGPGVPFYLGPGPIGNDIPVSHLITGALVMTFCGSAGPIAWQAPYPPFPAPGDDTIYATQFGYYYSLELSTLSICYQTINQATGFAVQRLMAYGEEVFSAEVPIGYTHPVASYPDADTVMPSVRWYHNILGNTINTEWGMGFSVHPLGHWAHEVNAELAGSVGLGTGTNWAPDLDIVSVRAEDGTRASYTHKDLFNSAFGQDRGYEFYTEAYPGKQLWDQGSFRTTGIWVTYR